MSRLLARRQQSLGLKTDRKDDDCKRMNVKELRDRRRLTKEQDSGVYDIRRPEAFELLEEYSDQEIGEIKVRKERNCEQRISRIKMMQNPKNTGTQMVQGVNDFRSILTSVTPRDDRF